MKKLKSLVNITQLMYPKLPVPCPKHPAGIYKGRSRKASPPRGSKAGRLPGHFRFCSVSSERAALANCSDLRSSSDVCEQLCLCC